MKRQLAHACRWLAARLVALANRLDPPVDPREAGRRFAAALRAAGAAMQEFGRGMREDRAADEADEFNRGLADR